MEEAALWARSPQKSTFEVREPAAALHHGCAEAQFAAAAAEERAQSAEELERERFG